MNKNGILYNGLFCPMLAIFIVLVLFVGVTVLATEVNQSQENNASDIYIGAQLYYNGKLKEAKLHFERILSKNQPLDPNHLLLLYTYLGLIYNELALYDNAIDVAKKAIKINSHKASAFKILGIAYFKKGLLNKAQTKLRKSIEINSKITYSHYYLGLIHISRGQPKLAIKEFLEEKRVNTDSAVLREIELMIRSIKENDNI